MAATKLRYGSGEITLAKSPRVMGLQRTSAAPIDSVISRRHGITSLGRNLGPFELFDLDNVADDVDVALDRAREAPGVRLGTHAFHVGGCETAVVPTGHIYLAISEGANRQLLERLLKRHALSIVTALGPGELIVATTRRSRNPVAVAAALQRSRLISIAEPDFAVPISSEALVLPTDPMLSNLWHLRNAGNLNGETTGMSPGADARVISAWQRAGTLGSNQVVVAVMDDGFDTSHPDLSGAGKIRAPWNFLMDNNDPSPTYTIGYPFFSGSGWIGDFHGTACAGLAVGNANGAGMVGVAPGAALMPLKMRRDITDLDVVRMFAYARSQSAAVVSCSWQDAVPALPLSTLKAQAISACAQQGRGGLGCVIVFAAGNDDRNINDPSGNYVNGFACHPDVIAVAASTSSDERADYSNYGAEISVCAPGGGSGGAAITTSDVSGSFTAAGQQVAAGYAAGSTFSGFWGTSAAAPIVAGICALLLSVRPSLSAGAVKAILQRTAHRIGDLTTYDQQRHSPYYGFGRVDAEAAVQYVLDNH